MLGGLSVGWGDREEERDRNALFDRGGDSSEQSHAMRKILWRTYWAIAGFFALRWMWNLIVTGRVERIDLLVARAWEQLRVKGGDPVAAAFLNCMLIIVGVVLIPGFLCALLVLGLGMIALGVVLAPLWFGAGFLIALARTSPGGAALSGLIAFGVIAWVLHRWRAPIVASVERVVGFLGSVYFGLTARKGPQHPGAHRIVGPLARAWLSVGLAAVAVLILVLVPFVKELPFWREPIFGSSGLTGAGAAVVAMVGAAGVGLLVSMKSPVVRPGISSHLLLLVFVLSNTPLVPQEWLSGRVLFGATGRDVTFFVCGLLAVVTAALVVQHDWVPESIPRAQAASGEEAVNVTAEMPGESKEEPVLPEFERLARVMPEVRAAPERSSEWGGWLQEVVSRYRLQNQTRTTLEAAKHAKAVNEFLQEAIKAYELQRELGRRDKRAEVETLQLEKDLKTLALDNAKLDREIEEFKTFRETGKEESASERMVRDAIGKAKSYVEAKAAINKLQGEHPEIADRLERYFDDWVERLWGGGRR